MTSMLWPLLLLTTPCQSAALDLSLSIACLIYMVPFPHQSVSSKAGRESNHLCVFRTQWALKEQSWNE